MGPFPTSYPKKFKYALVGAYRGRLAETGLPSPLLPRSIPIKNKEGKEAEFMNRHMTDTLNNLAIHQNFTSGYSPQSSGAAEVNVRIIKQVIRRLLETANLFVPWWSHALNTQHNCYNVGNVKTMWVKRLEDKKKQGAFAPRGELGRLLVVQPMSDRSCDIGIRGTTPRPLTDKLAEAMSREERKQ
eukprot:1423197-Amphidinium_carterae.2